MIKNTTKITLSKHLELSKHTFLRRKLRFLILIEVLLVIFFLVGLFTNNEYVFVTAIMATIILPLILYFLSRHQAIRSYKSSVIAKNEPSMEYIFEDDIMYIRNITADNPTTSLPYKDISHLSEDKNNLYVWVNLQSAYIIDIGNFTEENASKVRSMINHFIGD